MRSACRIEITEVEWMCDCTNSKFVCWNTFDVQCIFIEYNWIMYMCLHLLYRFCFSHFFSQMDIELLERSWIFSGKTRDLNSNVWCFVSHSDWELFKASMHIVHIQIHQNDCVLFTALWNVNRQNLDEKKKRKTTKQILGSPLRNFLPIKSPAYLRIKSDWTIKVSIIFLRWLYHTKCCESKLKFQSPNHITLTRGRVSFWCAMLLIIIFIILKFQELQMSVRIEQKHRHIPFRVRVCTCDLGEINYS